MNTQSIPKPSSGNLATRPENEERRAQAVVKTGLIDAPNADLFQIYCDLAKDLTGYEQARFSLFDGEAQCSMAPAMRATRLAKEQSVKNGMFAHMCF